MIRRALLMSVGVACLSATMAVAANAGGAATPMGAVSCSSPITIGMLGPFTGAAASIGLDQLHWAKFFASQWNATHTLKINILPGDTQLTPSVGLPVAQSFASNAKVVGVIGPAGSQEVIAYAKVLMKGGLAFISGSATKVSLGNGQYKGYFFRVVPDDNYQGTVDSAYMEQHLGVTKGTSVMVINDEEAYSLGIAGIVTAKLKAAGVNVDSESVSQSDTDFSALVAKVTSNTKVVFVPFQIASEAQLVAQQLKEQGKTAVVFGTDGTFDSSSFNVVGSYVSFFAPDVDYLTADAGLLKQFHKQYPGGTTPFGAPNYVAAEVYADAAVKACAAGHGSLTRASLRAEVAKTDLKSTILDEPMSFASGGDAATGTDFVFKIESGGKYVQIT